MIKGVEKSRLGLEKSFLQNYRSGLGLEILTKPGLGLVSVSKNVVSSNPVTCDPFQIPGCKKTFLGLADSFLGFVCQ